MVVLGADQLVHLDPLLGGDVDDPAGRGDGQAAKRPDGQRGVCVDPFGHRHRGAHRGDDLGARTLELFLEALFASSGGRLPESFVVTLPKVTIAEQPRTAHDVAQAIWGNVAVTQAYLTLCEVLGHVDLLVERGDVVETVRAAVERAEPALLRAGAAVELDAPESAKARFDRDALARIVGNLLDNAEKYSRQAPERTIALAARQATIAKALDDAREARQELERRRGLAARGVSSSLARRIR